MPPEGKIPTIVMTEAKGHRDFKLDFEEFKALNLLQADWLQKPDPNNLLFPVPHDAQSAYNALNADGVGTITPADLRKTLELIRMQAPKEYEKITRDGTVTIDEMVHSIADQNTRAWHEFQHAMHSPAAWKKFNDTPQNFVLNPGLANQQPMADAVVHFEIRDMPTTTPDAAPNTAVKQALDAPIRRK